MSYPDWDFEDVSERTPDEVDKEAEEMLVRETVRLPEYSARTPDDELLRVSSALERMGFVFYRPQGGECARVIPKEIVDVATAMQHEAFQRRRVARVEESRAGVERYAQDLRAKYDSELAARGAAMRARTMQKIAESEAA